LTAGATVLHPRPDGETMFIIAQLPLADFRPLITGGKGRLSVPDWSSDNLDSGFVRGFGKISARNGSGLGLGGEDSFADVNNALRIERVEFRQSEWNRPLPIALWFRRFYYDGQIAGRFEIGFMVPEDDLLARFKDQAVEPSSIAQAILSTNVLVRSVDGSTRAATLANCSDALGLAYVASTTRNDALSEFPIAETYGLEVCVGKPNLHVRVPSALQIQTSRDRRYLNAGGDPEFFITSARGSQIRNNVFVQASGQKVQEESASERITRSICPSQLYPIRPLSFRKNWPVDRRFQRAQCLAPCCHKDDRPLQPLRTGRWHRRRQGILRRYEALCQSIRGSRRRSSRQASRALSTVEQTHHTRNMHGLFQSHPRRDRYDNDKDDSRDRYED
jgi:hypothetical protein